jgi:putative ABC transport system permease protein
VRLRTRPDPTSSPVRPADVPDDRRGGHEPSRSIPPTEGPTGPGPAARRRRPSTGGRPPRGLATSMVVRDFARNRGVTTVLVVLMMLAVVLATASAGTLVRLIGAASSLMARADAPHVVQMHAGPYDQQQVDRWVAGRPEVAHQQTMLMLGIDGANLYFDGEPQTTSIQQNALVVPNAERDLLLDLDDQPITEVEAGTILPPVVYQVQDGLEVGDTVTITASDGFAKDLTIAGFARDSIMNPAITSSKRLAVSPQDLDEVRAHTGEVEHLVSFWLHDPATQTGTFERDYLDSTMPKAGQLVNSATFRMLTMIGDGMAAAVVILVSMLLLVVGLLCLRFSFLTAAEQDYREIGVLKAIGVAPRDLRRIYLTKYALLAAVATGLGLLGGAALTPLLTRDITRYMGTAPSIWNWIVPIVTALAVFVVLVLFTLVLLRRFRRISPVTALRSGSTSQQRRGIRLRLSRSRMPVHLRLGTMDVIGRWPVYLLLFFVFAISTFIMIVPINSATTATAPGFIHYMGTGPIDLRIDLTHADDSSPAQFAQIIDELGADPDVVSIAPMVTTRNGIIDRDGNAASLYVENGDHTRLPVTYADGRAPTDETEIALSLLAMHQVGGEVGDTLPMTVAGQDRELTIVGSYQDITRGGTTSKASLPTDDDEVMWYMTGVVLAPGVDPTEAAQAYGDRFAPATVADIEQWRTQTLGPIAGQITTTAIVAAVTAAVLAMLMTALFTRMLLARDAGQIAIQRAIGANDGGLRQQYLTRILLVLVLGVAVGTLAANTLGQTLFNLMFEWMFAGFEMLGQGTSRIDFAVQPLLAYLALPAALIAVVTLATVASARSITTAELSSLTTE